MTIEEKSMAYAADKMCKAFNLNPNCINRTDVLIPKFCGRDIEQAYEDGATEALASQWVSVDDELPEVDTLVLTRKRNAVNLCDYDGENFYNILPEYKVHPTHWMRILPLKEI